MSKNIPAARLADSIRRVPPSPSRLLGGPLVLIAALALVLTGLPAIAPSIAPAAAATALLADPLNRTVAAGWGTAPNGTTYTVNPSSSFGVTNGIGRILVKPGMTSTATAAFRALDLTAGHHVSFSRIPDTGSVDSSLRLRSSSEGYYQAALRLKSSGDLHLELARFTPASGSKVLSSQVIEKSAKPGTAYRLELSVVGTTNVSLKARAYTGNSAPSWQIVSIDSGPTRLTNSGEMRLVGYESASAKSDVTLSVDNLTAVSGDTENTDPGLPLPPKPEPTPMPGPAPGTIIPAGALFVANRGSDSAVGTSVAPLKTISRAISTAGNGATIVVRSGTYHESLTIPSGKTLHIRSYPGETVWLDGSRAISGFAPSGTNYVLGGWTAKFDSSPTYTRGAGDNTTESWGFVNPKYPMAAHPDQLWIGGVPQQQVGSEAALAPGKFFVDEANKRLYVGSNPIGKSVSASALVKALSIRSDNSSVDGINVRKYSPSVPDMGAVTAEKPGIQVKNLTIEDSATTGINISAINNAVRNVTIRRSGMLGMNAVYADGLEVDAVISTQNNTENFNSSPVSGGIKVVRSRGIDVANSILSFNSGPGLWIDESVYDSTISGNDLIANSGHGLSLEISSRAMVVNNRILENGGNGIKLNNTGDVKIWNNTISGKNRTINAVQDNRRGSNKSDPGHDPRQPFPDTTMPWIIRNVSISNNVLSNLGGGNANFAVEDFSKVFTAEQMKIVSRGNLYHRVTKASPKWSVVWAKAAANPAVFTTLAEFQRSTGQESSSQEITMSNLPAADVASRTGAIAQPLPADVATLIGSAGGLKVLGAIAR